MTRARFSERDLFASDGAVLSDCKRYRYLLWRAWDARRPAALFVMLNPSTADDRADDPTIRRCRGFAQSWGKGGIRVVNVFAFRATKPQDLRRAADPYGPENDQWIAAEARLAAAAGGPVVCAWGSTRWSIGDPARRTLALIREAGAAPQCLRVTASGHPSHPLYLPRDLTPQPFDERTAP